MYLKKLGKKAKVTVVAMPAGADISRFGRFYKEMMPAGCGAVIPA